MKKLCALVLSILLTVGLVMPVSAATAAKGSAENPYTFKEIPATWIKQTKKNGVLTGYTVTVPNKKKATFKLSGTTFLTVSALGADGKYAAPVALTKGKLKTVKNMTAFKLVLRTATEKAPANSKAKPKSDVPKVNVSTRYEDGMSWSEVRADINAAIGVERLMENGNLVYGDGVSPSYINVLSTSNGYQIKILGWRRDKNSTNAADQLILGYTRKIFNYFWGEAGDAAFLWYDEMMTTGESDPADFGFTDTAPTKSKTTLVHNATGIKIRFEQGTGFDAFHTN